MSEAKSVPIPDAPQPGETVDLAAVERVLAAKDRLRGDGTTHWDECWRSHADCLAHKLLARVRALEAEVERLKAENTLLRQPVDMSAVLRLETALEGAADDWALTIETLAGLRDHLMPYVDAIYHDGMRAALDGGKEKGNG